MTANEDTCAKKVKLNNTSNMQSFLSIDATSHFPIQNLPFGIFSTAADPTQRIGVAIGEQVLDVKACVALKLIDAEFDAEVLASLQQSTLNAFMAVGKKHWTQVRQHLQRLLSDNDPALRDHTDVQQQVLIPMKDVSTSFDTGGILMYITHV